MSDLANYGGAALASVLLGGSPLLGIGGKALEQPVSQALNLLPWVKQNSLPTATAATGGLVLDKWARMELGLNKKGKPVGAKKYAKWQKKLEKRKARRWWEAGANELRDWRDEDWGDYMTQGLPSEQELFDQFAAGSVVDPMAEIGQVTDRINEAYSLYPAQLQRQRAALGLNPLLADEAASEDRKVGLDRSISIVDAQNRALQGADARADDTMNFASQVFGNDLIQSNEMMQGLMRTELQRKLGTKKANAQMAADNASGVGNMAGMALAALAAF